MTGASDIDGAVCILRAALFRARGAFLRLQIVTVGQALELRDRAVRLPFAAPAQTTATAPAAMQTASPAMATAPTAATPEATAPTATDGTDTGTGAATTTSSDGDAVPPSGGAPASRSSAKVPVSFSSVTADTK